MLDVNGGYIFMDFFGGQLASASIVSELIGINFADCEVVCLRKADHQATDGGMRLHHGGGGEGHANAFEPDQFVQQEVDGDVGQTRVTYCWTDALKLLLMQFCHRELFVWGISP